MTINLSEIIKDSKQDLIAIENWNHWTANNKRTDKREAQLETLLVVCTEPLSIREIAGVLGTSIKNIWLLLGVMENNGYVIEHDNGKIITCYVQD